MKYESAEKKKVQDLARGLEAARMTAIIRTILISSKYIPIPPEIYLPKPIYKIVTRRLKGLFKEGDLSHIHQI